MEPKVKLVNVTKKFNFFKKSYDKLLDLFSLNESSKKFIALKNISFEVYPGESIGIVGINGSGKSTLSSVLAGILNQSSGEVYLNGESSLIAISAGLNNNLTGLENIKIKCLMLGIRKKEIQKILPNIIEFADIGEFIEQPVKNYSSGMKSRLGFAISAYTNPDILIIDEALSVGDQTFYEKCMKKIDEFKKQGKTIFFISHSIGQVRKFADRVIWLHFGEIKKFAEKDEVLQEYSDFIKWFNRLSNEEKQKYKTDMLSKQFNMNNTRVETLTRKKESGQKKNLGHIFQIVILLIGLFCSGLSLFSQVTFDKVIELIQNNNSSDILSSTDNNSISEKTELTYTNIKQEGIIIQRQVSVFSNPDLLVESSKMRFGDKIEILAETNNNLFLIKDINGMQGYIESSEAVVNNNKEKMSNHSIEDIIGIFPESFANSYSFFLSYLDSNYINIKNNLKGYEIINGENSKETAYMFNVEQFSYNTIDNMIDSITIYEINDDIPLYDEMKEQSSISDRNNQLYLIQTNNYNLILDTLDRTIKISVNKK
ncbi:Probable o-antigen/lipopolysaccharide transport ATP-binding protein ABC transporter RfbE [Mycobacteroides abscessus subsp. abscessus]|nr:Probable o-antigen/lipopolysaccharide transport ATP-binding protein ABC transporter RfbE [Mycobacteroides abscessus subsp. abscessus]